MRPLQHLLRDDCDQLRLLIDEFELQEREYNLRNAEHLEKTTCHDQYEYVKPKAIGNYGTLLKSFLIIEIHSLLDFYLPEIASKLERNNILSSKTKFETGNSLEWIKSIIKSEPDISFSFNTKHFNALRELSKLRNDIIHNGGYVSEDNKKLVSQSKEIHSIKYMLGEKTPPELYNINFQYCRKILDAAECFMLEVNNISFEHK